MSKYENNKGRFQKGNIVNVGRKHNAETIDKIKQSNIVSSFWKGKELPEELKEKMRLAKLGNKHWNWKGGITNENAKLRNTNRFRSWRKEVLELGNNECSECGATDDLCADHIKSFAFYPELRFEVSNGRVLCRSCHLDTANFGGRRESSLII